MKIGVYFYPKKEHMKEIKPKFRQQGGKKSLFVRFTYEGKRREFSLGLNIDSKYWDQKKEAPRINYPAYHELKERLVEIEKYFIKASFQLPKFAEIKKEVLRISKGLPEQKYNMITFGMVLVDQKYNAGKNHWHVQKGVNMLVDYHEETGNSVEFADIDNLFYKYFTMWINKRGYSNNYVNRLYRAIREIKTTAIAEKITKDDGFVNTNWKVKPFKSTMYVHTWQTLEQMEKLDFNVNEEMLEIERDVHLVSCYTGCRIQDVTRMNNVEILEDEGEKYLKFYTLKTETPVVIPLLPTLQRLYSKYDKGFPKPTTKHNKRIKEVMRRIFGDKEVMVRKSVGGKVIRQNEYLYNQVSSHSGRRTFATLFFQLGVPIASIKEILGHASIKQTESYLQLESLMKQQTAKEMINVVRASMDRIKSN